MVRKAFVARLMQVNRVAAAGDLQKICIPLN
jgi:hypothetical protein